MEGNGERPSVSQGEADAPSESSALTERLHELARASGAAGTGVCLAEPFRDTELQMQDRVASGASAGLSFTYRDPAVSTDVRRTYPWAERLFVVAHSYLPEAGTPHPSTAEGRVARFAERDHYLGLEDMLETASSALREEGYRAEWLRDDNRLVDRAAAVRAGVGWWGKNTMVLMPGAGPWVLLGSVVTDAPLDIDAPMKRSCGSCEACLPACPTGALVAPGILDANLCIAYWLQAPGVIPREIRVAIGDRVYGCDDCIEACPPGSKILEDAPIRPGVDLVGILRSSDRSLLAEHSSHFFIPDRRARYLRRNALVALGNSSSERAIDILAGYAGHPDWVLRLHACWAIGRIGGRAGRAVLVAAREQETDVRVSEEIELALQAAS